MTVSVYLDDNVREILFGRCLDLTAELQADVSCIALWGQAIEHGNG